MHVNGYSARAVMRQLRELTADGDQENSRSVLREIARRYQREIVFQGDEELDGSIALLEEKSRMLGIDQDPDVVCAIEAIRALPHLGW